MSELSWNAKAKLVSVHTLAAHNGLRAKLDDTSEFFYQSEFSLEEEPVPLDFGTVPVESRTYGTMLEVEPQVNNFGSISMNFNLEYHTAEPQLVALPNGVNTPRFHPKKINTTVGVKNGGYVLVGTWKPTGRPEHAEVDLLHVVFATASHRK